MKRKASAFLFFCGKVIKFEFLGALIFFLYKTDALSGFLSLLLHLGSCLGYLLLEDFPGLLGLILKFFCSFLDILGVKGDILAVVYFLENIARSVLVRIVFFVLFISQNIIHRCACCRRYSCKCQKLTEFTSHFLPLSYKKNFTVIVLENVGIEKKKNLNYTF